MKEKMKEFMRWRYWAFLVLPLVVIVYTGLTSPDGWRDPMVKLLGISWSCIAVFLAHSARTALIGYVRLFEVYKKAMETSEGASRVFLGVCILMGLIFASLMPLVARADTVPDRAKALAPLVVQETDRYFPDIARRSYVGALIEKETCISMTHRYCWSTTAQLKTSREEGASLGQFTRAYDKQGALRFDALAEVKTLNPEALKEYSWDNVYTRADLGIRAILVKQKDCDIKMQRLSPKMEPIDRLAFCDAAYNGGYGGMQADRKICAKTEGCDPNKWFGHVEKHSLKNKTAHAGYGQSWFDINRKHVAETIPYDPPSRRAKYIPYLGV